MFAPSTGMRKGSDAMLNFYALKLYSKGIRFSGECIKLMCNIWDVNEQHAGKGKSV